MRECKLKEVKRKSLPLRKWNSDLPSQVFRRYENEQHFKKWNLFSDCSGCGSRGHKWSSHRHCGCCLNCCTTVIYTPSSDLKLWPFRAAQTSYEASAFTRPSGHLVLLKPLHHFGLHIFICPLVLHKLLYYCGLHIFTSLECMMALYCFLLEAKST